MSYDFSKFTKSEKKSPPKKENKSSTPQSRKRPQVVQKSTIATESMITQDDLQTLKNDLLEALNHMNPEGLEQHIFSRVNLIHFIGKRGSRGTKLCELRDFFYPTPAGEIDKEVQKLRKEGLLKKNRHGWMSLTNLSS